MKAFILKIRVLIKADHFAFERYTLNNTLLSQYNSLDEKDLED